MPFLSVGDAAREIAAEFGVALNPKVLSDLIYQGHVNAACCPLIGGRRMISRDYMPWVVSALRRVGKLRKEGVA